MYGVYRIVGCLVVGFLMFFSVELQAADMPRVHIIATGGTIAGVGATSVSGNYKPAQLDISSILKAIPDLKGVAQISSEQIFSMSSQDMGSDEWLKLSTRVNEVLNSDSIDGVVITHGTDVMEESAYFLNLTVKSEKPVVFTGAMRPATSISTDGTINLFNAVVVAAAEESKNRGVMIAMNGQILSSRYATKSNTIHTDTFLANNGTLGEVYGGKIYYSQKTEKKHTSDTPFDVRKVESIPRVAIVYGYAGADPILVKALIDNRYDGIIYAGVGNGNIHKDVIPELEEAVRKGVAVVRSSRLHSGIVTMPGEIDDEKVGFVTASDLNPQKARVLLMLSLLNKNDRDQIQQNFLTY